MIAIVDYRAGNLTSVRLALDSIDAEAAVTDRAEDIRAADRVIFPGVGAAGTAMQTLRQLNLADVLSESVRDGKPFLGICLGTQIIFEHTEEDGGVDGIGLVAGDVRLFRPDNPRDKVPQMGWNRVRQCHSHPLFAGIPDESEFYFVHSYYPKPSDPGWVLGETEYAGVRFASVTGHGNLVATQFHPEKSGRIGLRFLNNFVRWEPATRQTEKGSPC